MDEIEQFRWVEQSCLDLGACVTFVETTDWQTVAVAFGGVVAKARAAGVNTLFEADDEVREDGVYNDEVDDDGDEDIPWLMLYQRAGWTIVLEICGWQGSLPEVLQRLAPRTVSAYWSVNANTCFSYVADHTVQTSFEVMNHQVRNGAAPDCLEDLRAGLNWDSLDWIELMFALAARITGITLTEDMLHGTHHLVPLDHDPLM